MGSQILDRITVRESKTKDLKTLFHKTLFNHPHHVLLQSNEAISYLLFIEDDCYGVFHCVIENGIAYSPYKSLFGGFETAKKVDEGAFKIFIDETLRLLKNKNVEVLKITLPSNFFRKPRTKLQRQILLDQGFEKVLKLKNHHIDITNKNLSSHIHEMEKRKLKKCNSEGLAFYEESADMLPVLYNFISVCRKEKNQPLNISLEQLQLSMNAFPDRYFIFSVKLNNEFFAVTIAVKVNDNVLYNFLPASPIKFNYLSPMVKLIEGLYNFGRQQKFKYLDLGVSTTRDGKDQETLLAFKKHMGGQRSFKVMLEKKL